MQTFNSNWFDQTGTQIKDYTMWHLIFNLFEKFKTYTFGEFQYEIMVLSNYAVHNISLLNYFKFAS